MPDLALKDEKRNWEGKQVGRGKIRIVIKKP